MVFSSLDFIFRFLPAFLFIYVLVPSNKKCSISIKNFILLLGSLVFYGIGERWYVLLMIATIVANYFIARGITYYNNKPNKGMRKFLFILSLIISLSVLFFFKYADFVSTNINKTCGNWFNFSIPLINLALPIGISFYTFQIISYVADVYNCKYDAEKNIISFGAYVAMFPQLIAGPIVKYSEVSEKLKDRKVLPEAFDHGLKIFIFGLGAKVIIANNISMLWNDIERIGYESISTPLAWLGAFAYSFRIYFDFWGYSLMAMGLGEMLGFEIPQNFNNPYISKSATEFWQRWHITLGRWFKENVYFPLGGSRCSKIKLLRNLLVVWALTGLWHGAEWNFIIWGLGFLVIISIEKLFLKKYLDKSKVLSHLYMCILIPVSWIVFAISDMEKLGIYLSRMFPFFRVTYESNVNPGDYLTNGKPYIIVFIASIIFCLPRKYSKYLWKKKWLISIIALIVFGLSIYYLSIGLDNPFLYYRF